MKRSTISPAVVQVLLHEADTAARRLVRRLRLPRVDLDDVRQDLLADLIARLPGFDASRGTFGAFAGTVMANRATRLAERILRHRQAFGAVPVSLDDPLPGTRGGTRGGLIAEAEGLAAIWGCWSDPLDRLERRLDLERGLRFLDDAGRRLAAGLACGSAHRLAQTGMGSRSELYRQTRNLRLTLMAAGVTAA